MNALLLYMSFGAGLALAQDPSPMEVAPVTAPPTATPSAAQPSAAPADAPPGQPTAAPPTTLAPAPAPAPGQPTAAPVQPSAPATQWAAPPDSYAEPTPAVESPPPRRRFVFAFLPALTMGISAIPSHNPSFFFGGRLGQSTWALGYTFTYSMGGAERYFSGFWATHRHHLTGMTSFGAKERGFASVGVGAALLGVSPVPEVEGRLGVRFGSKKYGVFGGLVRVGWDVGHREQAPMPQFGLFIGFALL